MSGCRHVFSLLFLDATFRESLQKFFASEYSSGLNGTYLSIYLCAMYAQATE